MKRILFLLCYLTSFFLAQADEGPVSSVQWTKWKEGRWVPYTIYTVDFPANGYLSFDTSSIYQPGDVIYLRKGTLCDTARSITMDHFSGNATDSIYFRVAVDESLELNQKHYWGNGSSITIQYSHYLSLNCERLTIQAPITSTRPNFLNVILWDMSDNITIGFLDMYNGGTGVQVKTEVSTDSATWYGRTRLTGIKLHHINVHNSANEAFYLGNTYTFRNPVTGNVPLIDDCLDPLPDTVYTTDPLGYWKRPLVYYNVSVTNCTVDTSGNDAYQFAAIDGLTVAYNTARQWAYNNSDGHKGGILIGGLVRNSNVHDNTCQQSLYGHGLWFYAEGPGHVVTNNLFYDFNGDGASIRGGIYANGCSNDFQVTLTNNTFAKNIWGVGIRVSGQMGGIQQQLINNNIIAEIANDPGFGYPLYIWTENNGAYLEGTAGNANGKYVSVSAAGLDPNNYLQELPGSPVDDEGYRLAGAPLPPIASAGEDQTTQASSVNLSGSGSTPGSGETITTYQWVKISGPGTTSIPNPGNMNVTASGLQTGVYIFQLTVTQSDGQTDTDQVQVTVLAPPIWIRSQKGKLTIK